MTSRTGLALFCGSILVLGLTAGNSFAQACKDEEAMIADYQKGLTELIETVRKEDLEHFQRAFHQKTCLSKLTLCLNMMNGLLSCLEKATQDTTATKEQKETAKSQREKYWALKQKIEQYRNALKAAENAKAAKSLVEKFEVSN